MTDRSRLSPEQQRAMEYLAAKGTHAPAAKLREQVRAAFELAERSFDEVPPEQRGSGPAGKWTPHQILNHLVLSHEPAVDQFADLLAGISTDEAIPAGLQTDDLPDWPRLRERLGAMHRDFTRLLDSATDETSLGAKAAIEMVVKVDGLPQHWYEPLDWKAFIQAIRMHTLEHLAGVRRP
jgi:hypothetical protein